MKSRRETSTLGQTVSYTDRHGSQVAQTTTVVLHSLNCSLIMSDTLADQNKNARRSARSLC